MKAIIMSHENSGSYLLDRDGCVWFAKGYTHLAIGEEVSYAPKSQATFRAVLALVAGLCLALVSTVGWVWQRESYAVYLDINPSIHLVFNWFDKLIKTEPLNDDGTRLVRSLHLQGSPELVVREIVWAANQQGFVVIQGDFPVVSVMVTGNESKAHSIFTTLFKAAEAGEIAEVPCLVTLCDEPLLIKAEEMGVSPGKLLLVEQLIEVDQTLCLDDLLGMSFSDLVRVRQQHHDEELLPFPSEEIPLAPFSPPSELTEDTTSPSTELPTVPSTLSPTNSPTQAATVPLTNPPTFVPTLPPASPPTESTTRRANPNSGPGDNSGNNTTNPNSGPGNNSGNNPTNPNSGPGNNSGNNPTNPNSGPGNNSGNNPTNPNSGSGNNSGNNPTNPNSSPGNNSGNNPTNPNSGPGNNSGNPNSDPGNNPANPNAGPGNNSGNPNSDPGNNPANPNAGPGNNSGNPN
ncbi:MAG: hypothetical protein FWF06_07365, partial [Symbiobacteriaceae bacterium]|nr:hypothetical protein [Symbiobacteriaceae bacterium]